MSNLVTIKTSDVTEALSYFIRLSMVLDVDREGYVYSTVNPEHKRIEIGSGDQKKPAVVYQEELPKIDCYVINPFAEGLGDRTPPQIFFFKIQRAALNARLSYAVDGVLQLALEQQAHTAPESKSAKKKEDAVAPPRVGVRITNILTRKVGSGEKLVVEEVDDKMIKEFHDFFEKFGDQVVEPVYKPQTQRSDINIAILDDPNFLMNLSFMRKKSIAVLQTIIRGIFDLKPDETAERFSSKRIEGCPSKFSSWIQSIYSLYKLLNEVIDVLPDATAPDHLVDLDVYQFHLDRLPAYTGNAKWMVQSAPPIVDTPANRAPGTLGIPPVVPQLTPIQHTYTPPIPRTGSDVPPGYKLMPGVIMADGTRGPPTMVPDINQTPQMPVPGLIPQPGYAPPTLYQQQPLMPPPQYGQPPGYYGQPQYAQPPMGYAQPGGFINPLAAVNQQQPIFNQGFSVIPGMPVIR